MRIIELSKKQFERAMSLITKHYGMPTWALPQDVLRWIEIDTLSNDAVILSLEGDYDSMEKTLQKFGLDTEDEIKNTLFILTYILRNCPAMLTLIKTALYNELVDYEIIKLGSFISGVEPGCKLTLSDGNRDIELENYTDWFRTNLIKPFVDAHLSLAKKDRQDNESYNMIDPRVAPVIWGTYSILHEVHGTKNQENLNSICEFIYIVLKAQHLIPNNAKFGVNWVQAVLETIITSKEKPSFLSLRK